MKRKLICSILSIITIMLFAVNCKSVSTEINSKLCTEKTDVFKEIKMNEKVSDGFSELVLNASLKTHLEGTKLFEALGILDTHHGKRSFKFLINIDGQSVLWEAAGRTEDTTGDKIIEDGFERRGHEAGDGVKYTLEKKIIIKPGLHEIFLALPDENYKMQFSILLESGKTNILVIKPVYRHKKSYHTRSYLAGLKKYEAYFNNKSVN